MVNFSVSFSWNDLVKIKTSFFFETFLNNRFEMMKIIIIFA